MNAKSISQISFAMLSALLLCSGCASVANHIDRYPMGEYKHYMYPGVQGDVSLINGTYKPECETDLAGAMPCVFVPVGILDLPLSAVVDTVLLPIDALYVPDGTSTKLPFYRDPYDQPPCTRNVCAK